MTYISSRIENDNYVIESNQVDVSKFWNEWMAATDELLTKHKFKMLLKNAICEITEDKAQDGKAMVVPIGHQVVEEEQKVVEEDKHREKRLGAFLNNFLKSAYTY